MFAWNCVEAGGKHLGTCIDRSIFLKFAKCSFVKFPRISEKKTKEHKL